MDALDFECNQEENLIQLVEALNNRSYQPATSVCFYIDQPKSREIFAAAFKDRIVHHVIYRELSPIWEKIFIDQSFACRPQKGTHKAAQILQSYLKKVTRSGKKPAYYLKMDIKNFFMSINKHVLFHLLCNKRLSDDLKWLLEKIIFHDPTSDYKIQGSSRLDQKVPNQKSLFHALENCGLPIGNLTSQFFANVYLNPLDQFAKHILKCRFYIRYVDDFILLSEDKQQLITWQKQIIQFLDDELLLSINENATQIDSIFNGVDFAGFIVRPFYKLCRRRVIGNCKSKLKDFKKLLLIEDNVKRIWKYDVKLLEELMATMNSYLGHFQHAQTRNVISKLFIDFSFLNEYFYLRYNKLVRKYMHPKNIKSLKQQVNYFTKLFVDHVILFQVGCYFECYGKSAQKLSLILNYQLKKEWRKFKTACGFHQRLLNKVCLKLDEYRISYVIIVQTGKYLHSTMERVPQMKVQFIS